GQVSARRPADSADGDHRWEPPLWWSQPDSCPLLGNLTDNCPLSKAGSATSPRGGGVEQKKAPPPRPRPGPEPRRSDAQRNRERILDVALTELTRSATVPLSTIARKAGVGQGTFYRNFPNRQALVIEVYTHEMQQVADAAAQLLSTR